MAVTTYLEFRTLPWDGTRRTHVWQVYQRAPGVGTVALLGHVAWYSAWRQYAYMPMGNTVYNEECLRAVAEFCDDMTKLHRGHRQQKEAGG